MDQNQTLQDKVSNLPTKAGVYQYKNKNSTIIYVGKAKNLRSRVRSYFQANRPVDAKTKAMVGHIEDVEVILVDSEAEALILEDTLIKKHKPKYNILLKDDKTYPYVRVTNEPYPRIFVTRYVVKDGSKYFGPFTEIRNLRNLMHTIRSIFLIRSCNFNINDESIKQKKHKICLDYHIKKCEGPCEGLVSEAHYGNNVKMAMQILAGRSDEVRKQLTTQMNELAENLKFEEANVMKERLLTLKNYTEKQKIVSTENTDRDVFGIHKIDDNAAVLVLKIREGKLTGKRHYIVKNADIQPDEKILQRAIEKWYMESDFIPKEIYLPYEPEDLEYLTDWLNKQAEKSIRIIIPKIGDKRKLVEMAETNAKFILMEYNIAQEKRDQVVPRPVISLQRDLRLKNPPRRIECFDNSHMQGTDLVSSMVVFIDGKPKKSEYRKYKNRTVDKNDDFAAMREVIERRYKRVKEEVEQDNKDYEYPDLIIVDGGKGQLSSAYMILKELGLEEKITIIGLAKRLEEVFFPLQSGSTILPRTSSSLRLIQHLRDEAHRFAITFHRSLRDKRTLQTELTEIEGIGEKTAQKLLIEFGSVENVKKADKGALLNVLNKTQVQKVLDWRD
jgi:excinuclease ABC subunit C